MRVRGTIPPATVPLGLLAVAVALTRTRLGDYAGAANGGNARPALDALAHGDLAGYAATQPTVGLPSLLLRAPLVSAAPDMTWGYRLGCLAILLAAAALAVVVDRRIVARAGSPLHRAACGALVVAGPLAFAAMDAGHPEEILGGVLVAGACLAAIEDRRTLAGVLLGLAIGNKTWALLAVPPVLLALDRDRVRVLLVAAGLAALCILPGAVADPDRYREISRAVGASRTVHPQSLWWPLAVRDPLTVDLGAGEQAHVTVSLLPFGLHRSVALPPALLAALAAWAAAHGRLRRREDALAVLGLVLFARAALDPFDLSYYAAPALLALTVRDALVPTGSLPVLALAANAGAYVAFAGGDGHRGFALWVAGTAVIAAATAIALRPRVPSGAATVPRLAARPARLSH